MPSKKLSDIEIAIRIVPTSVRWPQSGTSSAWTAAHDCVDVYRDLVRGVDSACIELEQNRGTNVQHGLRTDRLHRLGAFSARLDGNYPNASRGNRKSSRQQFQTGQFRTVTVHAAPGPRSSQLRRKPSYFWRLIGGCHHDIKNRHHRPTGLVVSWCADRAVDYPLNFDNLDCGKPALHSLRAADGDLHLLGMEADGVKNCHLARKFAPSDGHAALRCC